MAKQVPTEHTHTESEITDLDHDDIDAIHDNVAAEINAIAEKGTPVDADLLIIEDSAAANAKKKVQIGNLPGGGAGVDYKAGTDTTGPAGSIAVVFATPYANANYAITLGLGNNNSYSAQFNSKATTGFTITTTDDGGKGVGLIPVDWTTMPYRDP